MKLYLELEAVNFQEFLLTHRRAAWGKSRMKLEDQVQIESEDGDSGEKNIYWRMVDWNIRNGEK